MRSASPIMTWPSVVSDLFIHNPVVSVDILGNILSRLNDIEYKFPSSKINPSALSTVKWPKENENVLAAKELFFLRMTHGSAIGRSAVVQLGRTLSALSAYCSKQNISVKRLNRHPALAVDFCKERGQDERIHRIASLGRLALTYREELGWTFLELEQIKAIENIDIPIFHQHPVIPYRIQNAVDDLAGKLLNEYLLIADQIDEVLSIWATAPSYYRRPGQSANWNNLMEKYPAVARVLREWQGRGVKKIAPYFTVIRAAALWTLCEGSTARLSEVKSLQRGCLETEEIGGLLAHLLTSETSKTQANSNAIWVVSPSASIAVKALERLLDGYTRIHPSPPNLSNFLFQTFDLTFGTYVRPPSRSINVKNRFIGYPFSDTHFAKLLSKVDARITQEDWAEAKLLTPTLDEKKFCVGNTWVTTPHQLRRTTIVRAASSGRVSQDSLSYQAKHRTWQMTAYYTQNYWHLVNTDPDNPLVARTNRNDAIEFSTMFVDSYNEDRQQILNDESFFSPYGTSHKKNTISAWPLLSLEDLQTGLKANLLKRNTLGICAQKEPCPWQSAETVRGCLTKLDGKPCIKVVINSRNVESLQTLRNDLELRKNGLRPNDHFARTEIEADIAATDSAIILISQKIDETKRNDFT